MSTVLNNYLDFPHVAQAFCIQRQTEYLATGKKRQETVYGITSLRPTQANPEQLLHIARGHWSIENRLHWVRDVTFDEDRSCVRTGSGPQVMASLRNLAISLQRLTGADYIPSAQRYCARLQHRIFRFLGISEIQNAGL